MVDFKSRPTKILEKRNLKTLGLFGLEVRENNGQRITNTDFFCQNILCDFQYSCNFEKYGDIRIDLISAFQNRENRQALQKQIKEGVALSETNDFQTYLKRFLWVNKWGKIFDRSEQRPDSVIYWFFSGPEKELDPERDDPVAIYSSSTNTLENFINLSWRDICQQGRVKLNDKSKLGDRHGSAFIPLNVKHLHMLGIIKRHPEYEELAKLTY